MSDLPVTPSGGSLARAPQHRDWISRLDPSRRAEVRAQLGKILIVIALLTVAAASFSAAVYYAFIASDQFVAEARFTVRAMAAPNLDSTSDTTGAPTKLIVQDTQVIMNYIESRALVERLQQELGLRELYSRQSIDRFSRLSPNIKIEDLVRYWKSKVDVSVQPSNGILTLTVKAFSPQEAARIAQACIKASEDVINTLNTDVVADSMKAADIERQFAETKLNESRAKLEQTRNQEAIISPAQSESASTELIGKLRGKILSLQQEYETQNRYVAKATPTLRTLQTRIQAAKAELERLKDRETQHSPTPGTVALSDSFTKIEAAALETQIAEKQYTAAVSRFENARLASQARLMYVEVFLPPDPPQRPKYPFRFLDASLFGLGAALACTGAFLMFRRMRG